MGGSCIADMCAVERTLRLPDQPLAIRDYQRRRASHEYCCRTLQDLLHRPHRMDCQQEARHRWKHAWHCDGGGRHYRVC